jgi:hypothetical protein
MTRISQMGEKVDIVLSLPSFGKLTMIISNL